MAKLGLFGAVDFFGQQFHRPLLELADNRAQLVLGVQQQIDFDDIDQAQQGAVAFIEHKVVQRQREAALLEHPATFDHLLGDADGFEQFQHHLRFGQQFHQIRQQHVRADVDEAEMFAQHRLNAHFAESMMNDAGGGLHVIGYHGAGRVAGAKQQFIGDSALFAIKNGLTAQKNGLGRQPILDREQRTVAYELLFRSGDTPSALVTNDMQATASVIHHAFGEMGVQAVLGKHLGFINISTDMLLSDLVELLPKTQVVLELLETIRVTEAVIERCRVLKQRGFKLALDDFVFDESYRPLLGLIDIVKIDLLLHTQDELRTIVSQLKQWPVNCWPKKSTAPNRPTFAIPSDSSCSRAITLRDPHCSPPNAPDPSHMALIQLLGLVLRDAETQQIEQASSRTPTSPTT